MVKPSVEPAWLRSFDDYSGGGVDHPTARELRWLQEVAATRENDLRGHRVAFTYHHYAVELDKLIHGKVSVEDCYRDKDTEVRQANANWFNFAVWATESISRNIRNQKAPSRVDDLLPIGLRRYLTPLVVNARASDGQRVARELAWSQLMVFLSTTYTFAVFKLMVKGSAEARAACRDARTIDDFIDRLGKLRPLPRRGRAVDPVDFAVPKWLREEITIRSKRPGAKSPDIGERHLTEIQAAFHCYQKASHLRVATKKGEQHRALLILEGNIRLTAVEQDVVDPAVKATLDHIPNRMTKAAEVQLSRLAERFLGIPRQLAHLDVATRLAPATELFDAAWCRLLTDSILVLAVPTETLRVGRNIPPRDPSHPLFDGPLHSLEPSAQDDSELLRTKERVRELLDGFDRSRGEGRGSAARDWRVYGERMNWAVTMLRSRQPELTLFWNPYSTEDEDLIQTGRLPTRTGDPTELEVQAPLDPQVRP